MANISGALMKLGGNALQQGSRKAIEKVANKAIEDVASKAATKALTGAGISTLAKGAGSTLDGVLGRSSGLVLPEPKVNIPTLAENLEKSYPGQNLRTIGDLINSVDDANLDKMYKNGGFSKKSYETLKQGAREAADINSSALNSLDVTSKSSLPILNRDEYYYDTLGKVGKNNVSFADVPDYMQKHLSNPKNEGEAFAKGGNDEILRDLFNDTTSDLSELYERYEKLAQGANANEIYTPENIDMGVQIMGKEGQKAEQDLSDRAFRGKIDVPLSSRSSGAKNIKVSRPTADLGVEETVVEPAATSNPALSEEIASLKDRISSAGSSNGGMGNNIGGGMATDMPGTEGFKVKLKNGENTTIKVGPEATGSTKSQRAVRKLDDMTAKSMNANTKQYRGVISKSGSIDGHYRTVAERMRAEKIDQANVAEKTQAALSLREDIKQEGLKYAEANGVTLNLSGIDNTIGLSATQKRKLAELGLGLDEMLGGNGIVSPTQAEEIYKTLRDYAYNWSDSKDALTKMAGNACEKEADAVRDIIDKTMDNINVDYKTSLLEEAAKNGEDPAYLRKIAGKPDFKFSDLRKDQSDWIAINDLAGNKIKEEPTLNVFGVDTGMNNPLASGAEKIREKIYERQAYGGGAGGNMGGGSVPPTGGYGAENTINFETTGGNRTGTLGSLLNKAKGAGLVGAGVLGGMMLGGQGGSNNGDNMSDITYNSLGNMGESEPEEDPYKTMTIGGYSYSQLEDGYMKALQAGDSKSADLIAEMMGMLDDKLDRYYKAKKNNATSSGEIASKQKAAINVLSSLMNNYQSQGPIGGRITGFLNMLTGGGYNPAVAAYDSGAQGSLGTIIKALGDTGALSEGDQKRALELLPKTTDTEQAAKMKYQQLIQILQGAGAQ